MTGLFQTYAIPHIECGTVESIVQKPTSMIKISANSLTTHIKL